MVNMHLVYGVASCSGTVCRILYHSLFSTTLIPTHSMFARLHLPLSETGHFDTRMVGTDVQRTPKTCR